jgi:LacI family transcriptional regulator
MMVLTRTKMALPRIPDIAQAAGVSTATVDRVLNERPGVKASTRQRVMRVAGELNYLSEFELLRAMRPKPLKLKFLLPGGTNRFLQMLGDYIDYSERAFAPFNVQCKRVFVEGFDAAVLVKALSQHGASADAVAFMALEHPAVQEEVLRLTRRGVSVITLISDLSQSQRVAYVGMDNRAAGRTAGLLIGRFIGPQTGHVGLIAGSRRYRAHEEREAGFLHMIEESFPRLKIVGLREGHDDVESNYRQTRALLREYPRLIGIYNIGGASEGVSRALREAGKSDQVVFIGHGLTPDTRRDLIDGTLDVVITQHPSVLVGHCVRIAANIRDGHPPLEAIEPVRMEVFFRENLP